MRVVKFCALLLSLIILNHNFYILQPIDLVENTEVNSAKLKLNPWCLIPFPRLVTGSWLSDFFLWNRGKYLAVSTLFYTVILAECAAWKAFPVIVKAKSKRDILEVKFTFSFMFLVIEQMQSPNWCILSPILLVILWYSLFLKCDWWYWDQISLFVFMWG